MSLIVMITVIIIIIIMTTNFSISINKLHYSNNEYICNLIIIIIIIVVMIIIIVLVRKTKMQTIVCVGVTDNQYFTFLL